MGRDENGRDADESRTERDRSPTRDGWSGGERPSTAVLETVAAATGRDPSALSPLDRHVDTEALDSLLTSKDSPSEERLRVSFDYGDVEVTVDTDGGIDVRTVEAAPEDSLTEPTTEAELHTMLRELLLTAFRNGLSVQGGWDARNGPAYPDWDVLVTRVEKTRETNSHGRT